MTDADHSSFRPRTDDQLFGLCARCGEPLGDDPPRLYWHEGILVFAYYHPWCPPVD